MNIATITPVSRIEPDARPAPAAIERIVTTGGRPADRDSLSENFNREIEAWARHAIAANGFGDCT